MDQEKGLWFFVKIMKLNGELKCVCVCFFCIVNLRGGVMSTGLCNLFVFRGLYHKLQPRAWVLLEV